MLSILLLENKKVRFNYFIEDKINCGIVLKGTEVKSIKLKQFSFNDSFASIKRDEMWLENLHIAKYKEGNMFNHEETRLRKLLITKKKYTSSKGLNKRKDTH